MNNRPLLLAVAAIAVAFPLIAIASPVAIPNAFTDGDIISADAFNENFDAIADAVNDNDARIAALEGAIESAGVPTGTIGFFPVIDVGTVDGCPPGWTEYADLRGRVPVGLAENGMVAATVGDALEAEGTRTIDDVPSHSHPHTLTITAGGSQGAHGHPMSTDGEHSHPLNTGNSDALYTPDIVQGGINFTESEVAAIEPAGDHTHTIASNTGTHGHTISGNISSTGLATVDVTMPYVQLLACAKE